MQLQNTIGNIWRASIISLIALGFTLIPFAGGVFVPKVNAATSSTYSGALSINAVVPNPIGADADYEYIQLKNNTGKKTNISNWSISGGTLPTSTTVQANSSINICRGSDTSTSSSASCDVKGVSIQLTNSGDTTKLKDQKGNKKAKASYDGSDVSEGTKITFNPKKAGSSKPILNTDSQKKFDSVTKALNDSGTDSGDTIKVKKGDYTSEGWIKIDKSVNLVSTKKHGATVGRFTVKAASTTIDGFEVVGDGADYNGISVEPDNGAASGVVIKNNYIHDIRHADSGKKDAIGIMSWSYGGSGTPLQNLVIKNNKIETIGSDAKDAQGFGIFIEGIAADSNHNGVTISGNTIKDVNKATINGKAYPGTGIAVLPELTNPTLNAKGTSSKKIITTNANATVKNNTVNNVGIAVSVAGDASQFSMQSNTINDGIPLLARGSDPKDGTVGITELSQSQLVVSNPGALTTGPLVQNNNLHKAVANTAANKPTVWSSIKDALNIAAQGDKIQVGDGDYTNEGWTKITKPVKLAAMNARKAKVGRFTVRASNVTIDGFEIVGDGADYNGISVEPDNDATSSITITDNFIHDIKSRDKKAGKHEAYGILMWESDSAGDRISGLNIKGNRIENIGSNTNKSRGFGIFVEDLPSSGTPAVIENNTIKNIHGATIGGDDYPGVGVVILPELTDPLASTGDPGIITNNANAKLTNNTFESNGVDLSAAGDVGQLTVRNNSFGDGGVLTQGKSPNTGSIGITNLDSSPQSVITNGPLDATKNYWGQGSGPNDAQIQGSVTNTPFYVDPQLNNLSSATGKKNLQSQGGKKQAIVNLTGSTDVTVSLPGTSTAKQITVVESNGPSGGASSANGDSVYLDIAADTSVSDKVDVSVTKPVSVLKKAGINNIQQTKLEHYTGGSWKELSTNVSVQGGKATLTATASGLSPFAIVEESSSQSTSSSGGGGGGGLASSRSSDGGGGDDEGEVLGEQDSSESTGDDSEDGGEVAGQQDTDLSGMSQAELSQLLSELRTQLLQILVQLNPSQQ